MDLFWNLDGAASAVITWSMTRPDSKGRTYIFNGTLVSEQEKGRIYEPAGTIYTWQTISASCSISLSS